MADDGVDDAEEIGRRHVGMQGRGLAVAATMAATEVAAVRALPEEGAQLVARHTVMAHLSVELKRQTLPERQMSYVRACQLLFFELDVNG